jgi:general secretion pathway protein B
MSYILEALKKADADREREAAAVPDLHAQPEAGAGHPPALGSTVRPLAIAAAALLLAALAWWWWRSAPAPTPAPDTAIAARETQARPQEPVAAPTLPAPPLAAVAPAAPTRPVATAPVAVVPPAPALPVATAPAPPRTTAPLPAPKAAASAPGAARVPTLAELPPEIRAQLPALVVGGSVYSGRAASRMVILGGQVFREGDQPVAGLVVEQIGLKSTVLSFRGQRFELRH